MSTVRGNDEWNGPVSMAKFWPDNFRVKLSIYGWLYITYLSIYRWL